MANHVSISFWEKQENNDTLDLLSVDATVYPNYHVGDIIYLESESLENCPPKFRSENIKGQYEIVAISHSAKRMISGNSEPTEDNPFPFKISSFIYLEVYVKPTEHEIKMRELRNRIKNGS